MVVTLATVATGWTTGWTIGAGAGIGSEFFFGRGLCDFAGAAFLPAGVPGFGAAWAWTPPAGWGVPAAV